MTWHHDGTRYTRPVTRPDRRAAGMRTLVVWPADGRWWAACWELDADTGHDSAVAAMADLDAWDAEPAPERVTIIDATGHAVTGHGPADVLYQLVDDDRGLSPWGGP